MKKEEVKLSYETLWKFIIRPPKDEYEEDFLVDEFFIYKNRQYQRKDYNLLSSEGYVMKCSFVEPIDACRPTIEMPAVLYLHGNSSSRLEGLANLKILLNHNINLFVFDFPGCGLSEGEYISLGYHEKDDVKILMDFLEKMPGVGNIGLWGRSMGAATTLLYAHKDPRVKAICVDSPFERFEKLAEELVIKQINLPKFLIAGALKIIKSTVKSKNGLDISKLNPIEKVEKTYQPALFVHAINDELINVEHSINLFNNYGGPKSLKCCDEGGHNTKRPKLVKNEIGEFFNKYLHDTGFEEDLMKKYLDKNENNIMNELNNYDNSNQNYEENEDVEDYYENIGDENEMNLNEEIYEEDYIMNQIIENQKKEKKNENNINKKEKENKNNLEEKRIQKIIKEEKNQMEQVKKALMNLNIDSNNNKNNINNINNIYNINEINNINNINEINNINNINDVNNINNINDININIEEDSNNINNGNNLLNSDNVDLLDHEEQKNAENGNNFENGGKF